MLFDNNLFTVEKKLLSILLMTIGSVAISFNGLVLRNIETADDWTIIFIVLYHSHLPYLYISFLYIKKEFLKKLCKLELVV